MATAATTALFLGTHQLVGSVKEDFFLSGGGMTGRLTSAQGVSNTAEPEGTSPADTPLSVCMIQA